MGNMSTGTGSVGGGGGVGLVVLVLVGVFAWKVIFPWIGGLINGDHPSSGAPIVAPPPGPPPPPNPPKLNIPEHCKIHRVADSLSDYCNGERYINSQDLYADIGLCSTGPCFAEKFLDLAKWDTGVVFEGPSIQAQKDQLRQEMIDAVRTMGDYLKQQNRTGPDHSESSAEHGESEEPRVGKATNDLPSIEGISELVDEAIKEVDEIIDSGEDLTIQSVTQESEITRLARRVSALSCAAVNCPT